MKKFLKDYWVEIVIGISAIFGAILLFGNFGGQGGGRRGLLGSVREIQSLFSDAFNGLVNYLLNFSLFDLIGWILIIGAFLIVFRRIRWRYRHNPQRAATVCPRCGSAIKRRHRSAWDRFLGKTVMPDCRRYLCSNPNCRWTGLRHQRYMPEPQITEKELSQSH